ncbi:WD40/YVTN/BNR-like repeat-containing protein [Haloferacaceae archaeon DSL9]
MTTAYAAMRDRLLVVDDPADPAVSRRLDGFSLECVHVAPERPDRVFVGTFGSGLQRSTDGGDTFERVGGGDIGPDAVMSVATSPRDPDVIWAGTEPSRVYRSTDGGDTWEHRDGLADLPSADEWSFPPRPDTHHVRWIEPDPYDPDHLYVGVEAGALVQTHDAGETWEDRRPTARRDTHTITTHPEAPGHAWVAAGDGYAETRDGGDSWLQPQEGLDHRYCWSVAVDPDDLETVLVSAAHSARSAHNAARAESYVYRRREGERWRRLKETGLPVGEGVVRAVLERGDDAGEFYAVTNRGLFHTDDAGKSWSTVPIDWPSALESQAPRGLALVHA